MGNGVESTWCGGPDPSVSNIVAFLTDIRIIPTPLSNLEAVAERVDGGHSWGEELHGAHFILYSVDGIKDNRGEESDQVGGGSFDALGVVVVRQFILMAVWSWQQIQGGQRNNSNYSIFTPC